MSNFKSIFFTLCLSLLFNVTLVNAADRLRLSDQDIEKLLIETTKKINAQLPTMVDPETRLDATMSIGKQMHNKYTMVNASASEYDKKAFAKEVKAILVNNQCNDENSFKLLKLGVSYHYIYQDKHGYLISAVKISKKDCGM